MSQSCSALQTISPSGLQNKSVGSKELFNKAWTLAFGNSYLNNIDGQEEEIRFLRLKSFNVYMKVMRGVTSNTVNSSYMRISNTDYRETIVLTEDDIIKNRKYSYQNNKLFIDLLNLFEECKEKLKKIKNLQKKLLIEVDSFQSFLERKNNNSLTY